MTHAAALVLALVEGITEFLPVSSTGHLIITAKLLALPQTEFVKSFEIAIQLGAILAVVIIYRRTIITKHQIWRPLSAAFIPTAIIGFFLYKLIKKYLLENLWVTVMALLVGGIILLLIEPWLNRSNKEKSGAITLRQAAVIGLFQSLSIIPGVSRSAASIVGAMILGVEKQAAVEFSFLLAAPTILAAVTLDLVQSGVSFTADEWQLLGIGFLGAFISALATVRWFIAYLRQHSLKWFGIYRILVALLFLSVRP